MNKLIYLTFFIVVFGPAAWAAELGPNALNIAQLKSTMQVLPNTCVKQETDEYCQIAAHIEVSEPPAVNYCLTFDGNIPKQCFSAGDVVKLDLVFKLNDDISIQIISEHGHLLIAQTLLKVAIYKPVKRHRRRFTMGLL